MKPILESDRYINIGDYRAELEVYECECGYHFGVDSSFLEQVGDVDVTCPSCKLEHFIKGGDS